MTKIISKLHVRRALVATLLLVLSGAFGQACAAPSPKVYLLRGFMNVFSLGLDDLAAKIDKRGIRTEVYNHTSWSRLASEIASEYKSGQTGPIVLIGHSWGGFAVINLVEALGQAGVPVALAVSIDTVTSTVQGGRAATFVNLYSSDAGFGFSSGALKAGPAFRGELLNVDLAKSFPVGHATIDKHDAVHAMILRHVFSAVRRPQRREVQNQKPS